MVQAEANQMRGLMQLQYNAGWIMVPNLLNERIRIETMNRLYKYDPFAKRALRIVELSITNIPSRKMEPVEA